MWLYVIQAFLCTAEEKIPEVPIYSFIQEEQIYINLKNPELGCDQGENRTRVILLGNQLTMSEINNDFRQYIKC